MARNNLGKTEQISVQSNFACVTALAAIVDELEIEGVSYLGKKPTRQAVVNGMLLWVGAMEGSQRKEVLREAFVLLEDLALGRTDDRREFQLINDLIGHYHARNLQRSVQGGSEQGRERTGRASTTILPLEAEVEDDADEPAEPRAKKSKGRGKK